MSIKLFKAGASVFVPENASADTAIEKTTDLCFAAHQDDIEIMAYGPIAACYGLKDKWFTGVTVTDGAGSPRSGIYEKYSDDDMKNIRKKEQNNAATVGEYAAQLQLYYSSKEVKDSKNENLITDIINIILLAKPEIIYTHNLADKHDTHVAVALRVIEAIKRLPKDKRPKKVISLEVWRSLDWLCDEDKTVFNTGIRENLAAALLGVYDSQISGGKRYDLAAIGRRLGNATFLASHDVDNITSASYGLDITEMIEKNIAPVEYINKYIDNFKNEISKRITKFN